MFRLAFFHDLIDEAVGGRFFRGQSGFLLLPGQFVDSVQFRVFHPLLIFSPVSVTPSSRCTDQAGQSGFHLGGVSDTENLAVLLVDIVDMAVSFRPAGEGGVQLGEVGDRP